jgi:hypothetical protein
MRHFFLAQKAPNLHHNSQSKKNTLSYGRTYFNTTKPTNTTTK